MSTIRWTLDAHDDFRWTAWHDDIRASCASLSCSRRPLDGTNVFWLRLGDPVQRRVAGNAIRLEGVHTLGEAFDAAKLLVLLSLKESA